MYLDGTFKLYTKLKKEFPNTFIEFFVNDKNTEDDHYGVCSIIIPLENKYLVIDYSLHPLSVLFIGSYGMSVINEFNNVVKKSRFYRSYDKLLKDVKEEIE